jgi:hypothetical protein
MKLDEGKSTRFLSLPLEETERTLEALKQAEETNDIEALKWCARRLAWLDETSETERGDDDNYPAHLFNEAWADALKVDPAPQSIAGIMAQIDGEEEPEELDDERVIPFWVPHACLL